MRGGTKGPVFLAWDPDVRKDVLDIKGDRDSFLCDLMNWDKDLNATQLTMISAARLPPGGTGTSGYRRRFVY